MAFSREQQESEGFLEKESKDIDKFLAQYPGGAKTSPKVNKTLHVDLIYSSELSKKYWDISPKNQKAGLKIEFKSRKRRDRKDESYDDQWILIEIIGNHGFPGWLFGDSNAIVFTLQDSWMITSTIKLKELIAAKTAIYQELVDKICEDINAREENSLSIMDKIKDLNEKREVLKSKGVSNDEIPNRFKDLQKEIKSDLAKVIKKHTNKDLLKTKELYELYNRMGNLDVFTHLTLEELKAISKIFKMK